jgi:APA family basic amino acid/polyamine antiporter
LKTALPQPADTEPSNEPRRVLTLFDCICIIVGTIIGVGIFKMPAIVSANVPNVYWLLTVWVFGGLIALIGALCFAELTTTYPDRGGDYGYLKRAYHRRVGFAFSWAAFWIIRPGNIGAMAMIFGEFAVQALPGTLTEMQFAIFSIIAMSITNLMGVMFGKTTQNILTVAKVVGILLIVVAAFVLNSSALPDSGDTALNRDSQVASPADQVAPSETAEETEDQSPSVWSSFWLAMVFVMFTFGGWNDIAFVATEVKNPRVNLLKSLVLGTSCVLIVYLLVNFALVYALGFDTMAQLGSQWQNPTSELVKLKMGQFGLTFFAVLVCVSCLGAINAMIFTSPRIYWATAIDYPALSWLAGSRDSRHGWWRAMVLQAAVTVIFVWAFGRNQDGIESIVAATAPCFWLFLALTVISLIFNRIRYAGQFNGYRVPFYPVFPLIFVMACILMSVQAWTYILDQAEDGMLNSAILIAGWVLLGFVLSFFLSSRNGTSGE